jgi:hypothetical protein
LYIRRPIRDTSVRVVGGEAKARAVNRKQAYVAAKRKAVKAVCFEARRGKAVET